MRIPLASLVLGLFLWSCPVDGEVVFDWATVGNPRNANDTTGFGNVNYVYRISKHEVTNSQYAAFLNAVAATDNFGGTDPNLYHSYMHMSWVFN